jgi:uncharacterized membrane protein YidH (DUF202 family)
MTEKANPNVLAQDRTEWAHERTGWAQDRTEWARARTIMALERTLMAWLRTAVTLISFGFTIYTILSSLNENASEVLRPNAPRNVGLFLTFLGMLMLTVGILEYRSVKSRLLDGAEGKVPFSMTLAACVGLLVIGLFTIMNILFGFGGL